MDNNPEHAAAHLDANEESGAFPVRQENGENPFRDVARPWTLAPELPLRTLDAIEGVSRLRVQLLHNRGVSGALGVHAFLRGEWRAKGPALLDLDVAVARIQRALADGERIVVFGDFDCDGVTSCALLVVALRALGASVAPFVPTRDDDGRGLNSEAVRELARQGASLIITTDCGTANVEEVELARLLGLDVIVTDHHPPHGAMAAASALVNPQRDGDPSNSTYLAGVGVAFRLAEALLAAESERAAGRMRADDGDASTLLDLVVVGTVADVVPLTPTNWALARAGLERLNVAPRPGLLALLRRAGLTPGQITARDISFALAPRLNAAGRLGQPMLAVALLITEDDAEAEALADQLDALNAKRQEMTETISAEAREQVMAQVDAATMGVAPGGGPARDTDAIVDQPMLVAEGRDWPLGILGLVAGRLADEFRRPVFVLSRGTSETRGSARGPRGWNLGTALAARSELFLRFGGHAQAAGFTLLNEHLEALRLYLRAGLAPTEAGLGADGEREAQREAQREASRDDTIQVDARLPLRRLKSDIFADVEGLEPYGPGFAEPVFVATNVRIVGCWRSGQAGRTLRIKLRDKGGEQVALWPKHGDLYDAVRAAVPTLSAVDVVYSLAKQRRYGDDDVTWQMRVVTITLAR